MVCVGAARPAEGGRGSNKLEISWNLLEHFSEEL